MPLSRPVETASAIWSRVVKPERGDLAPEAARGIHQVDRGVANQHGGGDEPSNLALARTHCNLRKGPNIAGRDPTTGKLTRLFHPRRDRFAWREAVLVGLTDVGRTTIHVLGINDPIMVETREALIGEERFPPK